MDKLVTSFAYLRAFPNFDLTGLVLGHVMNCRVARIKGLQVLKQQTSRKLKRRGRARSWQRRYNDFNVHNERKRIEKLRYMHRNPVNRGLVEKPEDWPRSSFRHYVTGI
jgi:hypothetical protein